MLRTVDLDDVLAVSERKPVLVAFIRRGRSASGQIEALEVTSRRFGREIFCCLFSFSDIEKGMRHFGVRGIPSFLAVVDGKEVERFIGIAEIQDMERLALRALDVDNESSAHGAQQLVDFD